MMDRDAGTAEMIDVKQAGRRQLMAAGTAEAANELRIRADRVERGMRVIAEAKARGEL